MAMHAMASAQEQTTQELPLPTGQTQTQSADKRWQFSYDSDVRYYTVKTTGAGVAPMRSNTTYAPFGLGIVGNPNDDWKIELGARGGYQNLTTSTGGVHAAFHDWTDTTISNTVTYLGYNGYQPFASMNVNAPTGQSFVNVQSSPSASDPDITQIAGFGQGWNFGPTVGVNIPLKQDLILTLSAGYTSRGNFLKLGPNAAPLPGNGPVQHMSPGDDTTLTAAIAYQTGAWSLQGSFAWTYESATKVDNINFFQTGQSFQLNGGVGYAWNDAWSSKLSATFQHTNLNKNPSPALLAAGNDALLLEAFDSNSNTTNLTFDTTYKAGKLSLGPSVTFLYRDRNGYSPTVAQFLPAKTLTVAGGVFEYDFNQQYSLNGRVQHIWVTTASNPGVIPAISALDGNGWVYTIGGKAQF